MNDEKIKGDSKDIEENKSIAAVGYIWILCFIPLLLKRDSKFAQFHAKQALVLFIVEVIVGFIVWVPFIGWILGLAVLVLAIMGILQALQGNYWEMPLIGQFAKKFNI